MENKNLARFLLTFFGVDRKHHYQSYRIKTRRIHVKNFGLHISYNDYLRNLLARCINMQPLLRSLKRKDNWL